MNMNIKLEGKKFEKMTTFQKRDFIKGIVGKAVRDNKKSENKEEKK